MELAGSYSEIRMGTEVLPIPSILEESMKVRVVPRKSFLLYERLYYEDIVLLLNYSQYKIALLHRKSSRRCSRF